MSHKYQGPIIYNLKNRTIIIAIVFLVAIFIFLCVVFFKNMIKKYFDREYESINSGRVLYFLFKLENSESNLYIWVEGKNYFKGSIDELRIYNISHAVALYKFSKRRGNEI
jgi:hypothetical protein